MESGYFPEPVGFISWEEKQEQARLKAQEARLSRAREREQVAFVQDFEEWLLDRSDKEKRDLLGNLLSPDSHAGQARLREIFAQKSDRMAQYRRFFEKADKDSDGAAA